MLQLRKRTKTSLVITESDHSKDSSVEVSHSVTESVTLTLQENEPKKLKNAHGKKNKIRLIKHSRQDVFLFCSFANELHDPFQLVRS